jgi:hypothetical protein
VVGYGPFSLYVVHKEGLCPSSGDINRRMMNNNQFLLPAFLSVVLALVNTAGWFRVLSVLSDRTEQIDAAFLAHEVARRRERPSQQTNSPMC